MKLPAILLAASALACPAFAADPAAVEEVRLGKRTEAQASWWGFDAADSTAILQAAVNSGVRRLRVDNVGQPWVVDPIQLADDQEIVFEPGVVVRAKRGSYRSKHDSLFTATLKKNVTLLGRGATLAMWRDDYDREPYEHAEWRHVVSIRSCTGVRIEGLTLAESGGDGVYLGVAQRGVTNKNVVIKDVVCLNNYRQGISVISAEDLLIENCVFRGTKGTAPQAGIDFEPNLPEERLVRCVMRNCLSEDNAGDGYDFYLKPLLARSEPISIRVENCRSVGNRRALSFTLNGDDSVGGTAEFVDFKAEGAHLGGIIVGNKPATAAKVRFQRCELARIAMEKPEVRAIVLSSAGDGLDPIGGVELLDCLVRDPLGRLPIAMHDFGGNGLALDSVGGRVRVEQDGRSTDYVLDARQLGEWFPPSQFKRVPRFKEAAYLSAGRPAKQPPLPWQRQQAGWLVWFEAGKPAAVEVELRAVGPKHGLRPTPVEIFAPDGQSVLKRVVKDEAATLAFKPATTGAYRVQAAPGQNRMRLAAAAPLSLYSPKGIFHFIGAAGEVCLLAPAGVSALAVRVAGANDGERVKATLLGPDGAVVESHDAIAAMRQFYVERSDAGKDAFYRLKIERPSQGVLEDYTLRLEGVPPLLATTPEALLRPAAGTAATPP